MHVSQKYFLNWAKSNLFKKTFKSRKNLCKNKCKMLIIHAVYHKNKKSYSPGFDINTYVSSLSLRSRIGAFCVGFMLSKSCKKQK